jgi:hypothetical protein
MPCPPPPCPHRPAAAPANGTGNGTHRPGLRLGEGCRHGPGDPHAPDMRAARRVHAEVRMMESMVMLLERIDARVADLTAQMEANGTSAERLARLEAQLDRLESLEARILAHLDEMTAHVARIEAHYAEEPVRPAPDHPEGRPDHGGRPSETGRPSGGRPPR